MTAAGASLGLIWKDRIILRLAPDGDRITGCAPYGISPEARQTFAADRKMITALLQATVELAVRSTAKPRKRRSLRKKPPPKRAEPCVREALHGFYHRRLAFWEQGIDYNRAQIEQLSFSELINLYWHQLSPQERIDGCCAGCRVPVGESSGALALPNGLMCHFDNCLVTYGERWRKRAVAELEVLGVFPPTGYWPP